MDKTGNHIILADDKEHGWVTMLSRIGMYGSVYNSIPLPPTPGLTRNIVRKINPCSKINLFQLL